MTASEAAPDFEPLPALYQRWVEAWLPAGIPREQNATCLDCAMCAPEGYAGQDVGFYEKSVKCCSYFPDLPNFLVGRAIAGDNPGAAALRAMINGEGDGRFVADLRVVKPNTKLEALYDSHSKAGFGRDPELRCPFAIEVESSTGPLCGIWAQRNGVCATFFCKNVKGRTGFQFWQTLRGLLTALEWSLSWWAITEIIDRPERVFTAGAQRAGQRNGPSLRPDAWLQWDGPRAAFYEACAERVEALAPEDVLAIAGMDARLYYRELQERFGALAESDPPARLRAAPFNVVRQHEGRAMVQALSCSDPFEAPAALLPLIGYFDGRPTAEVIEAIREATRVRLDPKLVRRLYDFGILDTVPGVPAP